MNTSEDEALGSAHTEPFSFLKPVLQWDLLLSPSRRIEVPVTFSSFVE